MKLKKRENQHFEVRLQQRTFPHVPTSFQFHVFLLWDYTGLGSLKADDIGIIRTRSGYEDTTR